MPETIDLSDLPEEYVRFIELLVEFLKERERRKRTEEKKPTGSEEEKIEFAAWPSGVKNKLTREEIYDYL